MRIHLTISFHADSIIARVLSLGDGSDFEAAAVRVRANDSEALTWLIVSAERERNQGRLISVVS